MEYSFPPSLQIDNDGDSDLAVTGEDGINERFIIYRNDEITVNGIHLLADNLDKVVAGPNPFKIGSDTSFRFERLTGNPMIKIYTIMDELVRTIEETDGDGIAEWDLKNEAGEFVAQGVYICEISTYKERKFIKIMIIK